MSPLGKNAFHCCNRYGIPSMEINEIRSAFITRSVELTVEIDLRRGVNCFWHRILLEIVRLQFRQPI